MPLGRAALLALVLALAAPRPARADDGQEIARIVAAAVGGVLAAIGTGGTIAFAVQDRSFTEPWLVVSVAGGAMSIATAVALAEHAGDGVAPIVGIVAMLGLATGPTYWSLRSVLSDAELGGPLSPPERPDPPAGQGEALFVLPVASGRF